MIGITTIIFLFIAHFIGDFFLQSDEMAINKSKSVWWLLLHTLVYSAVLIPFGFSFAIINFILHTIVDFFTSKITSYLWIKEERHWFFTVIGLDQTIHLICLVTSYSLLGGIIG